MEDTLSPHYKQNIEIILRESIYGVELVVDGVVAGTFNNIRIEKKLSGKAEAVSMTAEALMRKHL